MIYQPDIDNGEHLLVFGSLTAKSINKGGGEFYIKGNVTVEQTIYGYYNHGRLIIDGNTTAVAVFPDDHYFRFGGQITGTIVNGEDIVGLKTGAHDISALRKELIKGEDYADSDKINSYINAGKHILKDELLPGFEPVTCSGKSKRELPSVKPEVLDGEEAREKVDMSRYSPFGDFDYDRVIYFEGDVYVDGNLNPDWARAILEAEEEGTDLDDMLILVKGNLIVDGYIMPGDDSSPSLFVTGNVACEILFSGDECIQICGNADVRYVLDGNYNDGSIAIDGITKVPYLLNSNHNTSVNERGAILINYFSDSNDFFNYDYTTKDFDQILVPAVYQKEKLDLFAFIDLLKEGKSPFKIAIPEK